MAESYPNAWLYWCFMGASLILSLIWTFSFPFEIWKDRKSWTNYLPPQLIVLGAAVFLVLFPLTSLPHRYSEIIPADELYMVLILVYIFWFMVSTACHFLKYTVSAGGHGQSFFSYVFSNYSDQRAVENGRSIEYAILGTFGSVAGPLFLSLAFGAKFSGMLVLFLFGFAFMFVFLIIRLIFKA